MGRCAAPAYCGQGLFPASLRPGIQRLIGERGGEHPGLAFKLLQRKETVVAMAIWRLLRGEPVVGGYGRLAEVLRGPYDDNGGRMK